MRGVRMRVGRGEEQHAGKPVLLSSPASGWSPLPRTPPPCQSRGGHFREPRVSVGSVSTHSPERVAAGRCVLESRTPGRGRRTRGSPAPPSGARAPRQPGPAVACVPQAGQRARLRWRQLRGRVTVPPLRTEGRSSGTVVGMCAPLACGPASRPEPRPGGFQPPHRRIFSFP